MENIEKQKKPERWSIIVDKLEPEFDHENGTVTVKNEHFSKAMSVGDRVEVASNENPEKEAQGKVLEINRENHTIKIKLLD